MQMTREEIVRDYLQAKNKSKQLKVLADLNLTTQSEIRRVLIEGGVEGVKAPKRLMKWAPVSAVPKEPETEVYGQIEAILAALPEGMGEKARWAAGKLAAEMFAEYLIDRLGLGEGDGADA